MRERKDRQAGLEGQVVKSGCVLLTALRWVGSEASCCCRGLRPGRGGWD